MRRCCWKCGGTEGRVFTVFGDGVATAAVLVVARGETEQIDGTVTGVVMLATRAGGEKVGGAVACVDLAIAVRIGEGITSGCWLSS